MITGVTLTNGGGGRREWQCIQGSWGDCTTRLKTGDRRPAVGLVRPRHSRRESFSQALPRLSKTISTEQSTATREDGE